ncbi:interleukin-17B-like [Styela clava]
MQGNIVYTERYTKGKVPVHSSILSQCNMFRTQNLKSICQRVAHNPTNIRMNGKVRPRIKYYKKYSDAPSYAKPFEVFQARLITMDNQVGSSLGCRPRSSCRENLPKWVKKENLRSISPWDYCSHYDETRFPQVITEASCLCKGCIDLNTGLHTWNGVSKPIPVVVSVIYRKSYIPSFDKCTNYGCYEKLIQVDVACHCYLPRF